MFPPVVFWWMWLLSGLIAALGAGAWVAGIVYEVNNG
jgi:hypothetical protein